MDAGLAAALGPDVIEHVLAQVPDALLTDPVSCREFSSAAAARARYRAYLTTRLRAPARLRRRGDPRPRRAPARAGARGSRPAMTSEDRIAYDFAVLRAVPHVHLGAFVPVGVLVHARTTGYLGMRVLSDSDELAARVPPTSTTKLLARYLRSHCAVAAGDAAAGPVGLAPSSGASTGSPRRARTCSRARRSTRGSPSTRRERRDAVRGSCWVGAPEAPRAVGRVPRTAMGGSDRIRSVGELGVHGVVGRCLLPRETPPRSRVGTASGRRYGSAVAGAHPAPAARSRWCSFISLLRPSSSVYRAHAVRAGRCPPATAASWHGGRRGHRRCDRRRRRRGCRASPPRAPGLSGGSAAGRAPIVDQADEHAEAERRHGALDPRRWRACGRSLAAVCGGCRPSTQRARGS